MEHKSNNRWGKNNIFVLPESSSKFNRIHRFVTFFFFLFFTANVKSSDKTSRNWERKKKKRKNLDLNRLNEINKLILDWKVSSAIWLSYVYIYIYRLIGELYHVCDFSFLLKATNCRYAVSSSFPPPPLPKINGTGNKKIFPCRLRLTRRSFSSVSGAVTRGFW